MQLLVSAPFSGHQERHEYREVKQGDVITFKIGTPYCLFTLGAYLGRGRPYET